MSEEAEITYSPNDDEPFMNERQQAYFRGKLLAWKTEILREARETLEILQHENSNHPDLADRASSETDRSIELRARDRQQGCHHAGPYAPDEASRHRLQHRPFRL